MLPKHRDQVMTPERRRFFEAEAERLMDRLYGTALRLTRDGTDAEDLVADALARAWTRLDSLQDLQCFEKWVFRILVNTYISEWRRRQAKPAEQSIDDDSDGARFSLFEKLHQPFLLWWGNPEQQLLDKLLREDIERSLDALPQPYRLVVVMVEIWGFTYAEAAETLEVPIGTVRSRLGRARHNLQRALWRQAGQLGIAAGKQRGQCR
jgi:RNA polymerase sigma-70 factor (ECF subfamily)